MLKLSCLEAIAVLLLGYAYLGKLIYGGVYWGRIVYWDEGTGFSGQIWIVALLLWAFQLCLPFGGFVMNCILIHLTNPSRCNADSSRLKFSEELTKKIAQKYPSIIEDHSSYIYQRCKYSYSLLITFLVAYLIGNIFLFFAGRANKQLIAKGKQIFGQNQEPLIDEAEV